MAALLPLLAMGIPALFGAITGGINIANAIKGRGVRRRRGGRHHKVAGARRRGGRVVAMRKHYKKRKGGALSPQAYRAIRRLVNAPLNNLRAGLMKRGGKVKRGRGVFADILGSIPLLGSIAGPIVRSLGGRVRKHGKGLSPMYLMRPYVGRGLLAPAGGLVHHRKSHLRKVRGHAKKIRVRGSTVGHGLSPMYLMRPYVGKGLLYPQGGRHLIQSKTALTPHMIYKPPGDAGVQIMNALIKSAPFKPTLPNLPYVPTSQLIGSLASQQNMSLPKGGLIHRKGHLRKIPGRAKKVRVRGTVVGRGLLRPAGGYVPYTFRC